jgi:membrane glycosyltransferase
LRWTELRTGLQLLSEMFIRGGVMTTIQSQLAGNKVVARLIMQPDADILLKINVDGPIDGLLPMQLQAAVLALTARLHGAKTRIESIRRVALLAIVLAISSVATFGMTGIHSILWQAVLLIALSLVALVARWMVGLAIHWALRRVV